MFKRSRCLLCGIDLEPLKHHPVQRHPKVDTCFVRFTDAWGVCLTDKEAAIAEALIDDPVDPQPDIGLFDVYPPVDFVLGQFFDGLGLARLGGASTGKGWSSYAVAQRCFYLYRQRYVLKAQDPIGGESEALAIGTAMHAFLALHYASKLGAYPAPEACRDFLLGRANPEYVNEAWRVFSAYRLFYTFDDQDLRPLAVEYDLKDPRTGESCRYDLIGFYKRSTPMRPAGTYVFEHKSSGRFDWDAIEGWANDGEILGEAALWKKLGMDKLFGPLRGVVVNILGKQKEPKFHRTVVAPGSLMIDAHFDDLRRWDALIASAKATNSWPRSRANCINRWGRCDWWEHCAAI